jgi:hypothetical protein
LHEEHEALELKGFVGNPEDTEPNWRRLLERKSTRKLQGYKCRLPTLELILKILAMNFKATEADLKNANIDIDDKIVRVSGGGYVGVLSVCCPGLQVWIIRGCGLTSCLYLQVYHELHCLVWLSILLRQQTLTFSQEALRRSTLRDYYYTNMTLHGRNHDARTIEHLSESTRVLHM